MKNIYHFILFLFIAGEAKAQQLTPTTISSGGSSKLAGSVLLEDNVGGFIVNTISTPTFMYTQGFIQPDAGTVTTLPPINNVVLNSGAGIDNAGTTFINGNIMLEFTVGEVASKTLGDGNNLLTQGILQPFPINSALPVMGLEFYAKRINSSTVQLDWKTIQEMNNKGFHIERKKENESAFAAIDFVKSNAIDGNSSFPLQYQKLDNNYFSGNTYYRLKQEDIDGRTTYSVIRIVKGDVSKQLAMQVWPVPAVGFFNVSVNGLDKPDVLQIIDMGGRLVKQFNIQNQTQQQVHGLPAGTYFIKLASDKTISQKVIVQ
jgi:hypothetical protein